MVQKAHFMTRISSRRVVLSFLPIVFLGVSHLALAKLATSPEETVKRVQVIVADLEGRLQMPQHVDVALVPTEVRMVAVQRVRHDAATPDDFIIRLDEQFFESLNEEELTAALAHELGHVWISTHHPYLQTEALANEIAMKAVPRESMKKIYAKLWLHMGTSGDIEQLLGHDQTQPNRPTVTAARD
jgi:hypothetical protein